MFPGCAVGAAPELESSRAGPGQGLLSANPTWLPPCVFSVLIKLPLLESIWMEYRLFSLNCSLMCWLYPWARQDPCVFGATWNDVCSSSALTLGKRHIQPSEKSLFLCSSSLFGWKSEICASCKHVGEALGTMAGSWPCRPAKSGFKSLLCHLWPVWLWASWLTLPGLSFLICEGEKLITLDLAVLSEGGVVEIKYVTHSVQWWCSKHLVNIGNISEIIANKIWKWGYY